MIRKYLLFAFLAALVLVALAVGFRAEHPAHFIALALLFGSVVTYTYPVSGTTPPTAAQMQNANMVTATINFADADTTASVTHNMNSSTTDLAELFPIPLLYSIALGTPSETAINVITTALTDSNHVTFTKLALTNGGGTYNCVILRPHSIIR